MYECTCYLFLYIFINSNTTHSEAMFVLMHRTCAKWWVTHALCKITVAWTMFDGGKRHLNFNVNEKATLYHKNGIFIISCIFFSKSQDFFAFKSILKFLMNESVLKNPTPLKTQNKRKKKVKTILYRTQIKWRKKYLGNIIIIYNKKRITKWCLFPVFKNIVVWLVRTHTVVRN